MLRVIACALFAAITFATVAAPDAFAQKKKIDVKMKWSGSVEDEKLMKPNAITNAKDLEAVWKAWKVTGDMPKVDFTKELVVAVYSVGSKLNLAGANLDEKGNLEVLGFGTRDIRPGFRYVLATVSNDGIKTVNGKELPK
jgi:hypothetical protein